MNSKCPLLYFFLLWLMPSLARATVPLPDMVLHGQLFDVNNQRMTVANNGNVAVEVKLNDAMGPEDPVIARTTLEVSEEANTGDIYILRIRREDGDIPTTPNTTVKGDVLHITINGVEVTETSGNALGVTDNLGDVRNLDLHLSSVLPPNINDFAVTDPTETTPGFSNQREVDVTLAAADSDGTITGWMITTTQAQPAANSPAWLTAQPTSFTLPDADGVHELFAWVRDSSNLVSTLNPLSSEMIILDRMAPSLAISSPGAPFSTGDTLVLIDGTAVETNEISAIEANINEEGWQPFSLAEKWTYNATLQLGENNVRFRSQDVAGNISEEITAPIITLEVLATGSVQVTILPEAVVTNGAQWKLTKPGFDSGFKISGLEAEVAIGEYTLSFSTIIGWETPAVQTITVNTDQKTEATGNYIEIIEPTVLFNLTLNSGWNFVSIPIDPVNPGVQDFFQGANWGAIWNWNGPSLESMEAIAPGKAYWVYRLGNPITLTIQGLDSSGTAVPLENLWNAVGPIVSPVEDSSYPSTPLPLTTLSFTNAEFIEGPIWYWDGLRFRAATQLEPGRGYLIFTALP